MIPRNLSPENYRLRPFECAPTIRSINAVGSLISRSNFCADASKRALKKNGKLRTHDRFTGELAFSLIFSLVFSTEKAISSKGKSTWEAYQQIDPISKTTRMILNPVSLLNRLSTRLPFPSAHLEQIKSNSVVRNSAPPCP